MQTFMATIRLAASSRYSQILSPPELRLRYGDDCNQCNLKRLLWRTWAFYKLDCRGRWSCDDATLTAASRMLAQRHVLIL